MGRVSIINNVILKTDFNVSQLNDKHRATEKNEGKVILDVILPDELDLSDRSNFSLSQTVEIDTIDYRLNTTLSYLLSIEGEITLDLLKKQKKQIALYLYPYSITKIKDMMAVLGIDEPNLPTIPMDLEF